MTTRRPSIDGQPAARGGSMQTTMSRVEDRYVSTSERRYHYREWGDDGSPPLLILHGVTGHSWEFDRVAERLASRFHIISLDQRGHGASDWAASYGVDEMAEDAIDVLDAINLERLTIVGHSMGGIVGYLLAARHPERVERLVVIDVGPETVASDWGAAIADAALGYYASTDYQTPDDAVAAYLDGATGAKADELRRFVVNNLRQREDGRWAWRFDARGLHASFARDMPAADLQWAALRAVTCPALVVRGGLSEAITDETARRIEQALQNGTIVRIAGAGHDVHIDQFEPLMEVLEPFVTAS
jgi:pimeloyl-ACP methyl ester carboxylesterase